METAAMQERGSWRFWETTLSHWLALNWETVLYAVIFLAAIVTRLYDLGSRAVSHDESLHMLYSYKLYDGEGYRHDPMMHGPFLFEFVAFMYLLFGDSTTVARVAVALFGIALVMLPYWFRPWLGRLGSLVASLMILISPSVTHYSRHLRHDIFNEFFTLLMFISFFQILLNWQANSPQRVRRWLYILAVSVSLGLTVMEISYIHGFVGVTFIVVVSLLANRQPAFRRWLFLGGLALLVVVGGLVLWLTFGTAVPTPAGDTPSLAHRVVGGLAGLIRQLSGEAQVDNETYVKSLWKMIQMVVLITGLLFGASTLGLSVSQKPVALGRGQVRYVPELHIWQVLRSIPLQQWGVAVGLGAALFFVLFTTFFTNPEGAISGTWGGLSYWLRQHDVQRGSQPWYYYLMLLPMYEFLPLWVGLAGGIYYLVRQARQTAAQAAGLEARNSAVQAMPPSASEPSPALHNYFVGFLVYWTFDNLLIYSWAGEKMPWLTVHMALPFIFLAAWTIDRALRKVSWRQVWERQGLLFAVLLPLGVAALIGLLSVRPFQGMQLAQLRDTGQWLGSLVLVLLLLYGLVYYGRRLGGFLASRVVFAALIVALALLTFRFSWMVSFINYDYVSEYLFYAHGAPDVTLAMQQIEDISRRTVGDKRIKVAYDNDSTWPLEWYFREYPNRVYYGDAPNRENMNAPIVIVGGTNQSKVAPYLGDRYYRFDYRLVWWPIETYKDQTPEKIWHTYVAPKYTGQDDLEWQAAWDKVYQNRKELWDVLFYRRHATPLNKWPYVHRFYMYVRKDVLDQLWDYHSGPPTKQEDPYAKGYRQVQAIQAVGRIGVDIGQFTTPRSVAIGPDGLWYVADSGNNRVQVLDSQGNVLRSWGRQGSAAGEFQEIWGIVVSKAGRVYVADLWNHRIQVFDPQGNYLFAWGRFADTKGQPDGEPGVFWGPRDLALDAEGNVYVADTGNKRIQRFSPDGAFLGQWGGAGVIPGRFDEPTSLAFGPDGSVYVADAWNRRIQKLSPDFRPLTEWPIHGWASQAVDNKPYVRVDRQGNVYASDPEGHRILVFDSQGNFLTAFGQYGFDMSSFSLPLGMAFDASGNLLVVDSNNGRILKFAPIMPQQSGSSPQ